MSRFVDLYKTLSVSPAATSAQIKAAFFKLAKTCHPDVVSGAENKFKQINEAYQTLSNNRGTYDSEYALHKHADPQQQQQPFTSRASSDPFSSPFGAPRHPSGASAAYQWGAAWEKPQSQSDGRMKAKESRKWTEGKANKSNKSNRAHRREFNEEFFWTDHSKDSDDDDDDFHNSGANFGDKFGEYFHFGEDEVPKHWKQSRRGGSFIFEDLDPDDFLAKKMKHRGRRKSMQKEELFEHFGGFDEDDYEIEFLDLDPRDFYGKSKKPTSRLTRKVLQRIRDDPRPSDEELLKKFGIDPQLFGFPPSHSAADHSSEEKQTKNESTKSKDSKQTKESDESKNPKDSKQGRAAGKSSTSASDGHGREQRAERKEKKQRRDKIRREMEEGEVDRSESESDSDENETGKKRKGKKNKKNGKLKYNFDTGEFEWANESSNSRPDKHPSDDDSSSSHDPRQKSEPNQSDAPSESAVSIYTLASRRQEGKKTQQPKMQRGGDRDNKIETEFFLSKAQVKQWLNNNGKKERLYGLFLNGSLLHNFQWCGKYWDTSTPSTS